MSKCSISSCCDRPRVAQCLTRIGVGALFFIPGIMKLMDPAMFQGLLNSLFGWTGLLAVIVFWIVVAFEVLGSLLVVAGPFIPRWLYKISLLGILFISLVALVFVQVPTGNIMPILFQGFATLVVFTLCITSPLCPFKACKK